MIYSYVSAASQSDPNGPAGDAGAALLVPNITDTRTQLNNMGLSKTIPVGNADAGAYFNNEVLAAVDYGVRSYIMFSSKMHILTVLGVSHASRWLMFIRGLRTSRLTKPLSGPGSSSRTMTLLRRKAFPTTPRCQSPRLVGPRYAEAAF